MKKESNLIYVGEECYEVIVYSVTRHTPCKAMESAYDLGGVEIEYDVLDLDGNEVDLGDHSLERIESELQEIYA
jgi:hypothetical protein